MGALADAWMEGVSCLSPHPRQEEAVTSPKSIKHTVAFLSALPIPGSEGKQGLDGPPYVCPT